MPRFRYTATNEKGKTVRGLLEAPSEEALYAKLRNDGLYMTDAQEAQKALATFRPLKTAVLADFCRNLGTLLTAGVPLVRASCARACRCPMRWSPAHPRSPPCCWP